MSKTTKKYVPIDRYVAMELVVGQQRVSDDNKIILPDSLRDSTKHGKWSAPLCRVVACGPEAKYVKEGDFVLISIANATNNSLSVIHDGDELHIMNEAHIAGILTDLQVTKLGLEAG